MKASGKRVLRTAPIAACVLLIGCHSIGGTVSGLSGAGLVLEDNGGDDLTLAGNGPFVFNTSVQDGHPYAVTIARQPAAQTCWVANGSGTVSGSDITNVSVHCGGISKVLVLGGEMLNQGGVCGTSLSTAEIYDSGANSFFDAGQMLDRREEFALVQLSDGRYLAAGGISAADTRYTCPRSVLSSAALYQFGAGGFSAAAPMNTARANLAGALLSNGDVLIVGGGDDPPFPPSALNTAEIYHAASNSFALVPSVMGNHRSDPTVTALPNGKALIAGGAGDGQPALATADLFDATTQTFQSIMMSSPRRGHTATLLADGTILLAGGLDASSQAQATAEIYDPASQTFMPISPMSVARAGHTATRLNDGRVLIAGGWVDGYFGHAGASAEIYDPSVHRFTPVASLRSPRALHTATALDDGRVLLVGGWGAFPYPNYVKTTEFFDGQSFVAGPSMRLPRSQHGAGKLIFMVIVGERTGRP